MQFEIVAADDNPDQALAAAHLLWDSSPEFLGHFYDGNQPRGFTDLQDHWLQPGGLLSHHHALIAVPAPFSISGGEIFGLALAMGGDHMDRQGDITTTHMATLETDKAIPDFFKRLDVLSYFHPVIPPYAFYLQNIAVRGNLRGGGMGEKLFQAIVARAREKRYTALHLDVVSDNPAVSFYRRNGMEVLSETDLPGLKRNYTQPSRYRMVLDIPALQ